MMSILVAWLICLRAESVGLALIAEMHRSCVSYRGFLCWGVQSKYDHDTRTIGWGSAMENVRENKTESEIEDKEIEQEKKMHRKWLKCAAERVWKICLKLDTQDIPPCVGIHRCIMLHAG